MKLSELAPDQVKVVSVAQQDQAQAAPRALRLSDLKADQVKVVSTPTLGDKAKSYADSALRGAAQGASAGFIDEATAGVGALYDVAEAALGKRGDISLGDAYRTRRDVIRKADEKASTENPVTYGAGAVGGTLLSLAAPGPGKAMSSAKVAKEVGGLAAGAMGGLGAALVRRMGTQGLGRAVIAANQAAYAGAGTSTADLTKGDVAGVAKDVVIGGTLGAGGSMVADKAAGAIKGLGGAITRKLKDAAESRAFKAAVGNQGKIYNDAVAQGRVNEIGREIIDSGALKARDVVNPLKTPAEAITDRSETKARQAWDQVEKLFEGVDKQIPGGAVDMSKVGKRALDHAVKIDSPNTETQVANLLKQGAAFERKAPVTFAEAQRLKNTYPYDPQDPFKLSSQFKRAIGEAQEDAVAKHAGGDALKAYQKAKKTYGALVTAEDAAEKLATRQDKNRTLSLTDNILGAAMLAKDPEKWPLALATAIGNKAMRERGSAAAAVTANKLHQALSSKFGPQLEAAAQKGPQALLFAHQALLNDSEYRALVGAAADEATTAIQRRMQGSK